MTPDDLRNITDPSERAKQAQGFLTRGAAALTEVRAIRDQAIIEWRRTATQRAIAAELGLTPGLIGQIDAKQQHMPKGWKP